MFSVILRSTFICYVQLFSPFERSPVEITAVHSRDRQGGVRWMTSNNNAKWDVLRMLDDHHDAASTVFLQQFILSWSNGWVLTEITHMKSYTYVIISVTCHGWCISTLLMSHRCCAEKPAALHTDKPRALVLRHLSFLWYCGMFWPLFVIWAKLWQLEASETSHTHTHWHATGQCLG